MIASLTLPHPCLRQAQEKELAGVNANIDALSAVKPLQSLEDDISHTLAWQLVGILHPGSRRGNPVKLACLRDMHEYGNAQDEQSRSALGNYCMCVPTCICSSPESSLKDCSADNTGAVDWHRIGTS